ncbi:MAG: hypothetical protein RQ715_09640 [Methylococcales bacterium]|nr:hypothetical protein [Methylococcales bacterium]
MSIRTKCLLAILGLFIAEIIPLPFTAMIGIYVARKRPIWFYWLIQKLYAEKGSIDIDLGDRVDPMKTRSRITYSLIGLVVLESLLMVVPVIIPLAVWVILGRPLWFLRVTRRLYVDLAEELSLDLGQPGQSDADHQRLVDALEERNREFAQQIAHRRTMR